jgi:hypothetical protein
MTASRLRNPQARQREAPESVFFPKTNVKADPVRQWHRPERQFFANGACHILAFAFLERYPAAGFHARWIKPAAGFTGNHIYVTNGEHAFDYHGFSLEERLLDLGFRRARRFFPGWDATLIDLPTDVLVSERKSREIDGLWLREPKQFLHDALPRARAFLDRFPPLEAPVPGHGPVAPSRLASRPGVDARLEGNSS